MLKLKYKILLFSWLLISTAHATVRTLNNNNPSPGQYITWAAVQAASSSGDTVYVSGSLGEYGDITITKNIVIIGTGHNPQKQNPLVSKFGYITITNDTFNINGLLVQRISQNSNPGNGNGIVANCFLQEFISVVSNGMFQYNVTLFNNIFYSNGGNFNYGRYAGSTGGQITINAFNNIFSGRLDGDSIVNSVFKDNIINLAGLANTEYFFSNVTMTNTVIQNNIFYGRAPISPFSAGNTDANCTFSYNVSWPATNLFLQDDGNNLYTNPLFVNGPFNSLFSYSDNYNLQPLSPCKNYGSDGLDIGAYGGPSGTHFNTYGEPFIPQIKQFNKPASVLAGSSFNVNIISTIKPLSGSATIGQAEYFWNTEPGIGNGIAITVPTPSDSVNFNAPINAAGLKAGYHTLYIRTKDNTGKWSLSEGRVLYVQPIIVAAEYFWNTDPGINNGTALSAFAANDSINIIRSISSAGLKGGYHVLYIRTKNADGKWSLSEGRTMYVQPKITEAEYFWDTDPGIDVATKTSAFTATDSLNFNPTITTTGLKKGYHTLYTRTKDTDDVWSLSEGRVIYIQPKIVEAEYFWDTDPGIDVATKTSPFTATDSLNFNPTISTTGLKKGYHTLYTRTKDTDRIWSLSEGRSIYIEPKITASEYFWDIDPGQGSGIALSSFTASDSINTNTSISTMGVRSGYHTLYTCTKDVDNTWSLSEGRTLYMQPQIGGAGESFWDTDPGFGNGTPMLVFSPSDSINVTYTTSTVGLSPGLHTFYTRFRTTENKWSLTEGRQLYITKPIIAVEYFIDTDPGVGLATNVPITPADTVILTNINVALTGLAAGNHNLYIRSKSFDKVWSTAEVHPFTVDGSVIAGSNIITGEYFIDTDPGAGLGTALSLTTVNDTVKVTQGISVAGYATGVHQLYMRYKTSGGQWSVAEVRPFTVEGSVLAATNIVAGEYFIDTDPGAGLATPVTYTTVNDTIKAVQGISVTEYAPGLHHLYMRYKTNANAWSSAEVRPFTIDNNVTAASNIIAGEYFVDTDPGPGLGTSLTLTTVNDTVKVAQGIPVAAYSPGIHHLYMRYKSYGGNWSVEEIRPFYIHSPVTTITHLEYFIDTDPGVGLATAIPVTGAPNDTVIVSISKLLPCLSNGNHYMYLRAKNNLGVWSVVDMDTINVTGTMLAQPIVSTGADTVCSPATVTMYADSTTGISYQWLLNGNAISGATFATYTATATGNYSLRQTCNASVVTSNVKSVVINVAPVITTCPGVTPVNNDGGLCSAIVTYAPAVASSLPVITYSQNSGTAFPVGSTTVYVVAANNCGVDSCQFNVLVADTALPVITCPANIITCNLSPALGSPNVTDNCGVDTVYNNAPVTFASGTTVITWTVEDIHGNINICQQSVTIQTNSFAVDSISSSSGQNICTGGNTNLTVVGGQLGVGDNWQWYTGSCGGTPASTGATINVSPVVSTTYFVRAEGACGNTACQSFTLLVSQAAPDSANVILPFTGMPANICTGTRATLSIAPVADATQYTWDVPSGGYFNNNPLNVSPFITTVPTVIVTYGAPLTSLYTTGVQAGNACGNSIRKTQKTRGTTSVPASVSGPLTACANSSLTYSTAVVAGAYSYLWTITGNATVTGTGNTVTVNFGPLWNGGTLCVAAQTTCYTSPAKCITISKSAATLNAISGTFTACPNSVLNYSVPVSAGTASYTWTVPAGATVTSGQGTNAVSVTYAPGYNTVGSICVSTTSICGVVSALKCKTVAPGLPSMPSVISGPPNGLCGQSVVYNCPSQGTGTTYTWTVPAGASIVSGQGGTSINASFGSFSTGNLCVRANNNCGSSAYRCITVKGAPTTPGAITALPSSWCANTQGIEFNVNVANVTGFYTLTWSYPPAPVATYVLGAGNSTSLLMDWGTGSGNINVTAFNACGSGTKTSTWSSSCREGEVGTVSSITVSPNPTTGMVNVNYTATKGNIVINVLDLAGRIVMTQATNSVEGANNTQLDMSKLAKGAYMLNVKSMQGNKQIKVVVE